MIKENIVFVLGAGASAPYKYPTGNKLKTQICAALGNPSNSEHSLLMGLGFMSKDMVHFASALFQSGKGSVDAFLEHRTEFLDVGKAAIALALSRYEYQDILFEGAGWYEYLYGLLNTSFEDFDQNNLGFITFNYDRSLEHFLFTALKNSYGKCDSECAEKLSRIPIIHLHGHLGPLPWQDSHNGVPYGNNNQNIPKFVEGRTGIKIIHEKEGAENDLEFSKAQMLIHKAKHVCFLGFGYNETNVLRLIEPKREHAGMWGDIF